ncbi:MAG TPA: sigma 54-interacting transcriptional regulator [Myxococcales bacterium]|nr:sigma 54-interacting transcriptional regulator [Myxococcales bacterium]
MKHGSDLLRPRDPRLPLFVKVATQPPLSECWSVNVSKSGIGLQAIGGPRSAALAEGSELELEFDLPDSGSRVQARGWVVWRHDGAPGARGEVAASLGVAFRSLSAEDRLKLSRYVQSGMSHVAVAFATREEAAVIEAALAPLARLHFASRVEEVEELVSRGDLAAVVACGAEGVRGRELLERMGGGGGSGAGLPEVLDVQRDLGPRVIAWARADPMPLMEALNAGSVFRVLSPPLDPMALAAAVARACRERGVRAEQRRVAQRLERSLLRQRSRGTGRTVRTAAGELVLESEAMRQALELARVAAPHPVAVLLQGETGTGKEILARTIHALSTRANQPLVVQDCGALTETLLDSELFGHVKGAFTGAVADHPGLFVLADGGTIFLDEIENTTPNLQARLLRVIETGEVRPVGGTQVRQVDVRLVAASNRDLRAEVRAGHFRPDLYYRLSSFPILVPPLRERRSDVLPLARHFLRAAAVALGRRPSALTREVEDLLLSYDWPGNARELRNLMERAALLTTDGAPIALELFPPNLFESPEPGRAPQIAVPASGTLRQRLAAVEREVLRAALERNRGVLRRAAAELKIDPVTLGRKVRRHGLRTGAES